MPIKILSVDDEPDMEVLIQQKFRRKIRKGEYEFHFAHNGLEALATLVEHSDIDVILTDINMPEMDGLTLLTKINELKNPILKTVIVSAYGDMENIRTAMNRGAFDFATKPIDFDDLETTLNKAINEVQILKEAEKDKKALNAIRHDLNIAKEIQRSILPKDFPAFPGRTDFDIHATMEAAKSVGGDFYDFFLIDDDHLGLVIADVSDKGVPAAIYMAVSRTIIRAAALKGLSPEECLDYSNNLLCRENVKDMFVTAFYGILNTKTGELKYSNAGHNPPYVLHANGNITEIEITGDTVLGILEGFSYKTKITTLASGDILYLYTDGVTEAMNKNHELYAEIRLKETLTPLKDAAPEEIDEKVNESLREFAKGAEQSDDITMLTMKFNGS
jgi:sigma-B regulation protein RsbU (phosphoserine phosphatase)